MVQKKINVADIRNMIGEELLVSDWISISQEEINAFGAVTRDPDPMHVDPDYARKGPFGHTILFGFQTLAMLSHMCEPLRFDHDGAQGGYDLNYGFNKIRFIAPVPVNARIRNHMVLKKVEERADGSLLITSENTIEIEGEEKPALVAEWLGFLSRETES